MFQNYKPKEKYESEREQKRTDEQEPLDGSTGEFKTKTYQFFKTLESDRTLNYGPWIRSTNVYFVRFSLLCLNFLRVCLLQFT